MKTAVLAFSPLVSASASYAGGPHHARLELVTYTPDTDWYEGLVMFKCSASH
ncbi:hypothetical protein [Marinobacter salexigens]|uniref:Uncharacterized protein n=1 Tax=Marinobacter salexigens TaxID=1925763 RepID=A0ABS6AA25_9GAMM|nr:hypothetical protein [Marinobacter salexigens]MBU2875022.1 hypothetical protein [Marinobacter salexigens]